MQEALELGSTRVQRDWDDIRVARRGDSILEIHDHAAANEAIYVVARGYKDAKPSQALIVGMSHVDGPEGGDERSPTLRPTAVYAATREVYGRARAR